MCLIKMHQICNVIVNLVFAINIAPLCLKWFWKTKICSAFGIISRDSKRLASSFLSATWSLWRDKGQQHPKWPGCCWKQTLCFMMFWQNQRWFITLQLNWKITLFEYVQKHLYFHCFTVFYLLSTFWNHSKDNNDTYGVMQWLKTA